MHAGLQLKCLCTEMHAVKVPMVPHRMNVQTAADTKRETSTKQLPEHRASKWDDK